ncbi:DNA alkylation repair protein [Jatrophihabitans sp. YIM 134969]
MTTPATPTDSPEALVTAVRTELREIAEPAAAPAMQAYMKTEEPFLGVKLPAVRRVVQAHPPADLDTLLAAGTTLWREAAAREERYAATMLLRADPGKGRLELLPFATEVIVTGAWWDHVDAVAHTTCELLQVHRPEMTPVLQEWATADDRWLRRSAVIGQLDARADTDLDLLTEVIEANVTDSEFFVRKAIGWALRQYARTDPAWVRAFVDAHPALSPLSRREALKHL